MQLNKIYWLKLSGHRPKHIPVINKYIGQITKWLPWDPWLMCHFESMQFHSVTCSCYWTCSSIYLSKFPTKPLLLFVFLQLSFQGTVKSNHPTMIIAAWLKHNDVSYLNRRLRMLIDCYCDYSHHWQRAKFTSDTSNDIDVSTDYSVCNQKVAFK